ncbi:MAG: hypothetical protein IPH18_07720 [Chitinophagaceae bacterium]|nr:hypothetical protein [Chitinophagaceae bacterium]
MMTAGNWEVAPVLMDNQVTEILKETVMTGNREMSNERTALQKGVKEQ